MAKWLIVLALMGASVVHSQKSRVLFLVNDGFPVSHSKTSYKILQNQDQQQRRFDSLLMVKTRSFVFYNVDTSHYFIDKKLLSHTGLDVEKLYSFSPGKKEESPYTRPDKVALEKWFDMDYDYVIVVNKIDILSDFRKSRMRFWFSLFDGDQNEVMCARHVEDYALSEDMWWSTMLQEALKPCESFEERLLNIIDLHSMKGRQGSPSDYLGLDPWMTGCVVLKSGDTLKGEINLVNPYQFQYRWSYDQDARIIYAANAQEVTVGYRKYESLFLQLMPGNLGKHVMVRVISKGKVDLYKLGEDESSKYYLRSGEEQSKVRFTPDKKRITNKKVVAKYFEANSTFVSKIYQEDFGARDLEKLVYIYNKKCISNNH